MTLTAPYNFVPLNETVIRPDWADQVSMDVPFSDAVSGTFDIIVEAETPLMIGGRTHKPAENEDALSYKERYQLAGVDAIPGSSLKGAVRNVLEIAAFGKMGPRMDDRRYAVRDLHNPHLYTQHLTDMFKPLVEAGWLQLNTTTGGWTLTPCQYSVVRQTSLEALHAERTGREKPYLGARRISGSDKYERWGRVDRTVSFDPDVWQARDDWAAGRCLSRADNVGQGSTRGTIVFTGQPNDREEDRKSDKKGQPKAVEFLFHSPSEAVAVPEKVREDFEQVHRDPNTLQPAGDWHYWRPRLMQGESVPVFWLPGEGADEIRAMGLAMMFRLAYRHTTHDLARQATPDHFNEGDAAPDLAETIFGYVREGRDRRNDQALRGRVRFAPARPEKEPEALAPRDEILVAPKPQFYPAYVTQRHLKEKVGQPRVDQGTYLGGGKARPFNAYTTYMDDDAALRGWKRYPVSHQIRNSPRTTSSSKVYTRFAPLAAGSAFRARVVVHNLRRVEFGALIWALTFGGHQDTHRHALGMGRNLGYGCCRVAIDTGTADLDTVDQGPCTDVAGLVRESREAFEAFMTGRIPGWADTPQVRHLLAMADPREGNKKVDSEELATMAGPMPFQKAKKQGLVLAPYIADDPGVWPRQTPPPKAEAPASSGRAAAPAAQKAEAASPRKGWAENEDGKIEEVEIIEEKNEKCFVRFSNGDTEEIDRSEIQYEHER